MINEEIGSIDVLEVLSRLPHKESILTIAFSCLIRCQFFHIINNEFAYHICEQSDQGKTFQAFSSSINKLKLLSQSLNAHPLRTCIQQLIQVYFVQDSEQKKKKQLLKIKHCFQV